MRQFILYALMLLSVISVMAQGRKIVLGSNNGSPEYLVGQIPAHSTSNYAKLKVEIFGGSWHNNNLGENHYYISSRDGLKIHQEVHGGSYSRYALKVYDNGNGYDIVVKVVDHYPSFYIRSWLLASGGTLSENTILDYDATGKTDITGQITITTLFATQNNGNVGIGTTSPDAKLTVKGNIHAEEVKVDLNVPAPDYVFKEGYDLKSLKEIQDHIKAHGHLPNIPSAQEMEENGIELGAMNMKLLEKIEELTLYTLQQQTILETVLQRTRKQEREIQELKKQMQ
ncbi:tail fiber protein [Muricauda sp. SCSIO 64092]|uniref:tail fiber protein n=1 Tax=Allomuricauda sp. SCSIO 64092 TaxID=2908842 RepID=UPI001FF47017|nr:tail fiber protein [Muricauda sp. SCSIO 64092]UOY08370.1 tail fiber protein [Muricauda sp. SCSIO 64092]